MGSVSGHTALRASWAGTSPGWVPWDGSIVLSPAGNRCAQQPGPQERRNKFGYVTSRPRRLSQAQHPENNLLGAA